jgi:hypothetical protein
MAPTLLLSALLTLPAAQTAPQPASAFHPRLAVRFQPVARDGRMIRDSGQPEIVCGMPMIRKTPADDPKIVLPSRDTGAAARRIEPQSCGASTIATPK